MKNVFGLLMIMLFTAGFTQAQEKKEQQQIKIVIADKDGKKVVIDTTFNTAAMVDSIKLKHGEVMTWVSTEGGSEGKSVVYVHKMEPGVKEGEVRYNVEVKTDDSGMKTEKTSYVVAKDGMVVTIEGGDEAKVKDLAAVIESKLGVTRDDKTGKQEVKEVTKKSVKK